MIRKLGMILALISACGLVMTSVGCGSEDSSVDEQSDEAGDVASNDDNSSATNAPAPSVAPPEVNSTPSFPAAPMLHSPAAGAGLTWNIAYTFDWSDVAGIHHYVLMVRKKNDLSSVEFYYPKESTQVISLSDVGDYEWSVYAVSSDFEAGDSSPMREFSVYIELIIF